MNILKRLRARARVGVEESKGAEYLMRAGYTARGVIYSLIAIFAFRVIFVVGGEIEGSRGALETVSRQPFGWALLVAVGIGLVGFSLWMVTQAVLDPDGKGASTRALLARAFKIVSAITHFGLALFVANLLLNVTFVDATSDQKIFAARVLSAPGGDILLGLFGMLVILFALSRFWVAWSGHLFKATSEDRLPDLACASVRSVSVFGVTGRGVLFAMAGGFMIRGALRSDPTQVMSVDEALGVLAARPHGDVLLALAASSLLAYGLHCIIRARFRQFFPAECARQIAPRTSGLLARTCVQDAPSSGEGTSRAPGLVCHGVPMMGILPRERGGVLADRMSVCASESTGEPEK